jgi:hypothetical protein
LKPASQPRRSAPPVNHSLNVDKQTAVNTNPNVCRPTARFAAAVRAFL